ncbi:unnamed protein product [Orchesella dallaii]|uniref:Uncharacterized protein n=1 Tax=Orchesella dallaii TaxID=48710 RepID=A0ABP1RUA7_9HEXA
MSVTGLKAKIEDSHLEPDVDLNPEDQETEDLEKLTTDEICRKFLPRIPQIDKKLDNTNIALKKQNEKIKHLNREVVVLKQEMAELKTQNEKLHNMVNYNNLVFNGLKEHEDLSPEKDYPKIITIFKEKLGFEPAIDKID